MIKKLIEKNYFLCEGYKTNISKRQIIYHHVPKTGGTTVSNLLLSLFKNPYRISGSPTKNIKSISCFENYKKNFNKIKTSNYDFICGHIQYLDDFKDRFSITTIRDPIERAISHYNMLIERQIINKQTELDYCFKNELIPKNPITQMFSCKNDKNDKVNNTNKEVALSNLNKLDMVVNFNQIDNLINYLVSNYNLPNILYQRLQKNKLNHFLSNKMNLDVVKKYNEYDLEIFSSLKKNNVFFKFRNSFKRRFKNDYFIYSVDYKIDGYNKLITQKNKYNTFINFLEKNGYIINIIN